jgi:hypothetical protein
MQGIRTFKHLILGSPAVIWLAVLLHETLLP